VSRDRTVLPAVLAVDAPDGTVTLHRPSRPGEPWGAVVTPSGERPVFVGWAPAPGGPTHYVCQRHGTGTTRHLCAHTRAATAARTIAEQEYQP